MGNMTYCQFENTFGDLQECLKSMQNKNIDELSESEQKYRKKLIILCKNITDEFYDDYTNG